MSSLLEIKPDTQRQEFFKVDFPIDFVFTWVDNTEEHIERRIKHMKKMGFKRPPHDNGVHRFGNNDELKYSIRSIYQYAPWVRTIYIIIDDVQRPVWLATDTEEFNIPIILITHSQLYGSMFKGHLPTFNSHSIECHLHRIPGLSEQFIYSNDDMFLGNDCVPQDFFDNEGKPKYVFHGSVDPGPKRKNMSQHAMAWVNNLSLLDMLFPRWRRSSQRRQTVVNASSGIQCPAHQAVPMLKSSFDVVWDSHVSRTLLWSTSETKFRQSSNIHIIGLLVYMNILNKRAVKGERSNMYIEFNNTNNPKLELTSLVKHRPKQFCLNDCFGLSNRTQMSKKMQDFLMQFFPYPTIAELSPN